MSSESIGKALDVLLAGISLARTLGINYREVADAQEVAESRGEELSAEQRQEFIDEAQAAIDKL